jgi:signal transduction histidine kinase/putative methionine-R-sulfoxide reductase with GAF domain
MTRRHDTPPPTAPSGRRPAVPVAVVSAMLLLAAADWYLKLTFNAAILYSAVLLLCWWHRSVRCVWWSAAVAVALTVLVGFLEPTDLRAVLHRGAAVVSVLASAAVLHTLFNSRRAVDAYEDDLRRRNEALEQSNQELAAREEEIARQNEELQSQTEELERQSEELRGANEELLRRERTLETLLALSRALSADLERSQTMARVCEALAQLVNAPAAAAILEQERDHLVVRCHTGFGPEGPRDERIRMDQSFASLVLSRGKTAYIEDLSLRPDLAVLQPRSGAPMVSVLAVPLRVGGWPVGTLELYSARKTAWSEEQVALAESLAAQASVSLEAASLFQKVEGERARLQTVLQTLPVGVKIAEDPEGAAMTGNAAMAALYQVPTDANFSPLGGIPTRRRGYRRNGQPVAPHDLPLLRALRTAQPLTGEELDIALPDGRTITVLVNAAPFFDERGAVTGGVGVLMDITAQKALQRELDARRREAEEASVRKTRFLAAVSHDIRTPANAISLLAELIRRTAANPALVGEVPDLAREMHESAMSLVNLLGDVLDVARFDSGKIEIQESDVSLASLLAEEYRRFQPLARDKGLALEFDPPAEDVKVRADRIKLSRVVGNLVGNAIKFTEHGRVRLEVCRNGDGWADLRVIDTGVGIAPEHQRYIFDEFFQLSNPERDRNKGTGLGLAICKRLVDAMGGRLTVQSAPGQGSTFTVSLPPAGAGPTPPLSA